MILKLLILVLLASASTGLAQLKAVMVDDSGVVQRPQNFWSANSQSSDNRTDATFANLATRQSGNGIAILTNSQINVALSDTNADSISAVRLMATANARPNAGAGTLWNSDSHAFWIVFDCIPRGSDTFRVVAGNSAFSTNIASSPITRAVGFEMGLAGENAGTGTNRVRLIAHNGTTLTNGPWVNVGNWFDRYTIGVLQNKSTGEVRLMVGVNSSAPSFITNAAISGGPTNNAGNGEGAWEVGMFSTQTNSGAAGAGIYAAWLNVTD